MKLIRLGGREEYLALSLIQRVGLRQNADEDWESYVVIANHEDILYTGVKEIAEKIHKIVLSHVCNDSVLDVQKCLDVLIKRREIEIQTANALTHQLEADKEWDEIYINMSKTRFFAVRVVKLIEYDKPLYEIKMAMPIKDEDGNIKPSRWFNMVGRGRKIQRYPALEEAVKALREKAAIQRWSLAKLPKPTETDKLITEDETDKI